MENQLQTREIKISEVLDMLEQGKVRSEIKTELNLTHSEMVQLFQHPKLKHRKPKTQSSFVLVDDTEEQDNEGSPTLSENINNVKESSDTKAEAKKPKITQEPISLPENADELPTPDWE